MLENTHLPTYRRNSPIPPSGRERAGPDGGKGRSDGRDAGSGQRMGRRSPNRARWAREAGHRLRAVIRTMFGMEGLTVAGFGVLWGRVSFYGEIWPFVAAAAVLAVARPGRHKSLAMAVPGILVGLATVQPWPVVAEYSLALAAVLSGLSALRSSPSLAGLRSGWGRESVELAGLPAAVALLAGLVRALIAVIAGRPSISFAWIGLEAAAVAFIAYMLEYLVPEPEDLRDGRRLLREELLTLSFLGAAAVLGLQGLVLWNLVELTALAGGWAVLVAAAAGGAAAGGAAGLGLVMLQLALGTGAPAASVGANVAALGIGGFASGLMRPAGRAAMAAAYVAAHLLVLPHADDVYLLLSKLATAAAAAGVFLLTPDRLAAGITRVLPQDRAARKEVQYVSRHVRYQVSWRLTGFARVFDELGRTFAQIPAASELSGPTAAVRLIQDAANTACGKCDNHGRCWEDDVYRSYQDFLAVLRVAERRGAVAFADVPMELRGRCLHPRKVVNAVNERLSLEKLENEWSRRLNESRQIVSTQLQGVADVMRGLASEAMSDIDRLEKVEARLASALWRHGLRPVSVEASPGGDERVVVDVEFTPAGKGWRERLRRRGKFPFTACAGGCALRSNRTGSGPAATGFGIEPGLFAELARLFGRPMGTSDLFCAANPDKNARPPLKTSGPGRGAASSNTDSCCHVRLQPLPSLRVEWYGASHAKDDGVVSGDSFSLAEMPDGRAVVLLSDGMGTGPRASLESGATVSMLEELMQAGLDREFAVKTVNSVLLLRSPEEVFATVDLLEIDRYSGLTEFVKIGAAPGFIKRGREISVVSSSTLPIGILSSVEAEVATRMLRPGDVIVMATDGLTTASPSSASASVSLSASAFAATAAVAASGSAPGAAPASGTGSPESEQVACALAVDAGDSWVVEALGRLGTDNPKEIVEALLEESRARRGGPAPADDATVVAVRITRAENLFGLVLHKPGSVPVD